MKHKLLVFSLLALLAGSTLVPMHVVSAAGKNNFVITDYKLTYTLSQDESRRSILKTTETITANFLVRNENHGIERAIPLDYDGHQTYLKITGVTDEKGGQRQYVTFRDNNGNYIVRIGDADTFVYGMQTYKLTYTQRDVTKYYADTKANEFYWDTNGPGWKVPIDNLSVQLRLDPSLLASLTNERACYFGTVGSTNTCELTRDDNAFTTTAQNVEPGENVTFAFGFKPDTFAPHSDSLLERLVFYVFITSLIISVPALIIGLIVLTRVAKRWNQRTRERQTVVNQFLPPEGLSVTAAADILELGQRAFSAQLIDFAVRGYVKIYQTREKSLWKTADYDVELVKDPSDLTLEEQEILNDIMAPTAVMKGEFNRFAKVGDRFSLSSLKNNALVRMRVQDNPKKLKDLIRNSYAFRAKNESHSRTLKRWAIALAILSVPLLSLPLLILALIIYIVGATLWPLSDKGLAYAKYLDGMKRYIKTAETDRLQTLQSPEGALKIGVDPNDPVQLVKLYERMLPYAILFGYENEWNERIGDLYGSTNVSPDWYSGVGGFQAAAFASSLSDFSSAANYSSAGYSSSSSSSTGGSSGGGFSGGGGGGGGGGGW